MSDKAKPTFLQYWCSVDVPLRAMRIRNACQDREKLFDLLKDIYKEAYSAGLAAAQLAAAPVAAQEPVDALSALRGLLSRYVGLVESGDAGNWDAEKEPEVIAARAVLASQPAQGERQP